MHRKKKRINRRCPQKPHTGTHIIEHISGQSIGASRRIKEKNNRFHCICRRSMNLIGGNSRSLIRNNIAVEPSIIDVKDTR